MDSKELLIGSAAWSAGYELSIRGLAYFDKLPSFIDITASPPWYEKVLLNSLSFYFVFTFYLSYQQIARRSPNLKNIILFFGAGHAISSMGLSMLLGKVSSEEYQKVIPLVFSFYCAVQVFHCAVHAFHLIRAQFC